MGVNKIMIVDDDPVIREILEINLRARGYEVCTAAGGQEAIELIGNIKPDVVVLDVIMPDLDGWEVLKIIRDSYYGDGELKILMLTAKATERDKLIGKAILKADEYLTKPFDLNELLGVIKKLLGD